MLCRISKRKKFPFIGIKEINLDYNSKSVRLYLQLYKDLLRNCAKMNISREVIKTYRIDQFEQEELVKIIDQNTIKSSKYQSAPLCVNNCEFYFYSIDMPDSDWLKYNETSNSFCGNTSNFILSKSNIECTQLSIKMVDLESVIKFVEFINPSILKSTKCLQIRINSNKSYNKEYLETYLDSLILYFENVKRISFNIFDYYKEMRKVMTWNLCYPISIKYNSIEAIKPWDKKFLFTLKSLNCNFYIKTTESESSESIEPTYFTNFGVTEYSCKYFEVSAYCSQITFNDISGGAFSDDLMLMKVNQCKIEDCKILSDTKYQLDCSSNEIGLKSKVINSKSLQRCLEEKEDCLNMIIPIMSWKKGSISITKFDSIIHEFDKFITFLTKSALKVKVEQK